MFSYLSPEQRVPARSPLTGDSDHGRANERHVPGVAKLYAKVGRPSIAQELTGTGTVVALSATTVNVGSQPINTTSPPMTVTLTNVGSLAP